MTLHVPIIVHGFFSFQKTVLSLTPVTRRKSAVVKLRVARRCTLFASTSCDRQRHLKEDPHCSLTLRPVALLRCAGGSSSCRCRPFSVVRRVRHPSACRRKRGLGAALNELLYYYKHKVVRDQGPASSGEPIVGKKWQGPHSSCDFPGVTTPCVVQLSVAAKDSPS